MNERLKIIRKTLGLSQKKFGEKIHISVSQISSYENKVRNIPERTILSVIREFNINPSWIRYGAGDMFNNVNSTNDLIIKINALSEEDQIFVKKIIDCLYKSSCEKRIKE